MVGRRSAVVGSSHFIHSSNVLLPKRNHSRDLPLPYTKKTLNIKKKLFMSVILDLQNMYKDHNRGLSFISCFPHFTFSNYVCTVKTQKFTLVPHSSWNFRLGHVGFPQNDRLSSCTPQDTESPSPLSHQVVHKNRFLVILYSWWPGRLNMSASSTVTSHSIWCFLHSEAEIMGLGKIPSGWNGPFHSFWWHRTPM